MSRIYKCDICGKVNPRSIRNLIAFNPDVSDTPLNKEKYYGFNIINEDICDECLNQLERGISIMIRDMMKESKAHANTDD